MAHLALPTAATALRPPAPPLPPTPPPPPPSHSSRPTHSRSSTSTRPRRSSRGTCGTPLLHSLRHDLTSDLSPLPFLPPCSGEQYNFSPTRAAYGNGLTQPSVSDADLSLFAAPIVAKPAPQQPKPTTPTQEAWAQPAVGPKPPQNDGWDNDDFGISWEAREWARLHVGEREREGEADLCMDWPRVTVM